MTYQLKLSPAVGTVRRKQTKNEQVISSIFPLSLVTPKQTKKNCLLTLSHITSHPLKWASEPERKKQLIILRKYDPRFSPFLCSFNISFVGNDHCWCSYHYSLQLFFVCACNAYVCNYLMYKYAFSFGLSCVNCESAKTIFFCCRQAVCLVCLTFFCESD